MESSPSVLFFCVLLLCCIAFCNGAKSQNITVGMPGGWSNNINSEACRLQALWFQNWVNARDDIMPDVNLNLIIEDHKASNGDPGDTLLQAVRIADSNNISAFIGSGFTADQQVIEYVATALNKPHICGFSSGALLSNKDLYPMFVRTPPSDSFSVQALIKFMVMMNWTKAAAAITDTSWGTGNKEDLFTYSAAAGVEIFIVTVPSGTSNCTDQVMQIKQKGYKIIIPLLQAREGYIFQYFMNEFGMVGPGYVYLLTMYIMLQVENYYARSLVLSNFNITTIDKILPYYEGSIGFVGSGGTGPLYNDLMSQWAANSTLFPISQPAGVEPYSWYMWDAMYTFALGVDKLLKQNVPLSQITTNGTRLLKSILSLDFYGVTGRVHFNANGDSLGVMNVVTYPINNITGKTVGSYFSENGTFSFFDAITFYGGTTQVPVDSDFVCPCMFGTCDVNQKCVCNKGYTGELCNQKNSGLATSILIVIIVVPIAILGALVSIGGYTLVVKRRNLVKEIVSKQQSEITRSEIKLHKQIGAGASGSVFTGLFRGTEVAVKRLHAANLRQNVLDEFKLESAIMCTLRHPNIVLFMGSCYDVKTQEMLIVMEFMSQGSLHSVLHDKTIELSYDLQVQIAYHTACGLNFLHQCNPAIIHCDIKSHNVLLDDNWIARISDFGITKFTENSNSSVAKESHSLGTIYWTAPEVLNGARHSKSSDVYSYGIVLYELFHRMDPYGGRDTLTIAMNVVKGARPEVSPVVPQPIVSLMRRCWDTNPDLRPSFDVIVGELRKLMTNKGMAPTKQIIPATAHFYVAVDVANGDSLWNANPKDMKSGMLILNKHLREIVPPLTPFAALNNGAIITFNNLNHALSFTIRAQHSLMTLDWPTSLQNNVVERGKMIWNGLRVKMAIHSSVAASDTQEGPTVDKLVYLLDGVGVAGAIVASSEVAPLLENNAELKGTLIKPLNFTNPASGLREASSLLIPRDLEERLSSQSQIIELVDAEIHDAPNGSVVINMAGNGNGNEVTKGSKSSWLISFNEFEDITTIASSSLADTKKATFHNQKVAIKHFHHQKFSPDDIVHLKYIAATAHKFDHPNLVTYVGVCTEPSHVSVVQEFVEQGSLSAFLQSPAGVTYPEKVRIAKEIARGMQYLSEVSDPYFRIHKNLKTSNILVGPNMEIKISDYALTDLHDIMRTLTSVAMAAWIAPEILAGGDITQASSVYPFGIILWELYTRQTPFKNMHPIKLVTQILAGLRPEIPADCPRPYAQLMQMCWAVNGEDRPSWGTIQAHLANL